MTDDDPEASKANILGFEADPAPYIVEARTS